MLEPLELTAYKWLIGNPGADAAHAALHLQLSESEATTIIDRLRELHLVSGDDMVGLYAISPEIAVSRRVDDDERRLRELQSHVSRERMAYAGLLPYFTSARATNADYDEIKIVEHLPTITAYLADLCRNVREELLVAQPTRHISAKSLVQGVPQDLEMLGRGVVRRNIYVSSNRDNAAVRNAVAKCAAAGAEYRVIDAVPLRLMCFDGTTALVSRSARATDRAAIIIRNRDIVQMLRTIYIAVWDSAEPFTATTPGEPIDVEPALLGALARGLTDEQIARRLGISVRTCSRHIRALMEAVGATSRFQAGVLLATRAGVRVPASPGPGLNPTGRNAATTPRNALAHLAAIDKPASSSTSVVQWP